MTTSLKKSEVEVVKSCNTFLKKHGWFPHTMWTGGIPLGNGRYATNPCKGIPDCIVISPTLKKLVWIEYKRSDGGVLSYDQQIWHKRLEHGSQTVLVVNSLKSLKEQFIALFGAFIPLK